MHPASETCPECGTAIPEGGSCRDLFHEVLVLESRIPGGSGAFPYVFAVATWRRMGSSTFAG